MIQARLKTPRSRILLLLVVKELREALRTRWFWLYTTAFTALAVGLGYLADNFAGYSTGGFGRTSAGLVNLVLLVVPLMGLTAGSLALAGERERGTLEYLLAQPVTMGQIFLGKWLGLMLALMAALSLGYGATGGLLSLQGIEWEADSYAALIGLTLLLAAVSLSLGLLISSLASRTAGAQGATLFLWLALVFLGDLGLMGAAVLVRMSVKALFFFSLLNPLQLFKVAAASVLQPSLDALGAVGQYGLDTMGKGLLPFFAGMLLLWCVVPLLAAYGSFRRREPV